MARSVNMEGVIVELPENGFVKSEPLASNQTLLGLIFVFGMFALTLPWQPVFSVLSLISTDIWTWTAIAIVVCLKFVMLLAREPLGGSLRGGFLSDLPTSKHVFLWEALGEMVILLAFCALILLKNPLVFGFGIILLFGRFRAARKPDNEDFERWYPFTCF